MGFIGMCGPKWCGFLTMLTINKASIIILAILFSNREWFSSRKLGITPQGAHDYAE